MQTTPPTTTTEPTTDLLACSHAPSPHGPHTTGSCTLPDGRKVCHNCADKWEQEQMKTAPKWSGYLSSDGKAVTNWIGTKIAVVFRLTKSRTNFGGELYRIRAVDIYGKEWYCLGAGEGMYLTMRRCKPRA